MESKWSQIFISGSNLSCFVPGCTSNSLHKKFIYLPKNHRKYWFEAVGLSLDDLESVSTAKIYVCEDHFRDPAFTASKKESNRQDAAMSQTTKVQNVLKRENMTPIQNLRTEGIKIIRRPDNKRQLVIQKVDPNQGQTTTLGRIIPVKSNPTVLVKSSNIAQQQINNSAINILENKTLRRIVPAPMKVGGNGINLIQQEDHIVYEDVKPTPKIVVEGNKRLAVPLLTANGALQNISGSPTFLIKRRINKTIRDVTLELIEKSPELHLGLASDRLSILKTVVCSTAKIPLIDFYITLKKLRLNEDLVVLAEYFEITESEVHKIFAETVVKLAKFLKFLIRWPEGKKYYDRHKNMPITFRSKLSYVQSLIECVETEVRRPLYPTLDMIDCKNFKFILTLAPTGVISYVSEAYLGNNDDLTIFNACNFRSVIPKYLSLVADPGEMLTTCRKDCFEMDSTTDSADEIDDTISVDSDYKKLHAAAVASAKASLAQNTLNVVNSELTSIKTKDFTIPTVRVREPACRQQIRSLIGRLREFKILQPYSVVEPELYQYINEILVIVSALTNLQR